MVSKQQCLAYILIFGILAGIVSWFSKNIYTSNLFIHELNPIEYITKPRPSLEKIFTLVIKEDSNISTLQVSHIDNVSLLNNEYNMDECIQINQISTPENTRLMSKLLFCADYKKGAFQIINDTKYKLYANMVASNEFSTNSIFQILKSNNILIDPWCVQTFSIEVLFGQERNMLQINCSALYDTNLSQNLQEKKVVRSTIKFVEGLGLFSLRKTYLNKNATIETSIDLTLKEVTPLGKK